MTEKTLYERLGGVDTIAAVVDRYSDEIAESPQVRAHAGLRVGNDDAQLARLKFIRTLRICEATGGPFHYSGSRSDGVAETSSALRDSAEDIDLIGAAAVNALAHFTVPTREKQEVLPVILEAHGHLAPPDRELAEEELDHLAAEGEKPNPVDAQHELPDVVLRENPL